MDSQRDVLRVRPFFADVGVDEVGAVGAAIEPSSVSHALVDGLEWDVRLSVILTLHLMESSVQRSTYPGRTANPLSMGRQAEDSEKLQIALEVTRGENTWWHPRCQRGWAAMRLGPDWLGLSAARLGRAGRHPNLSGFYAHTLTR